jgi:hypothetical protein
MTRYSKLIAAIFGAIATAVSLNLVPDDVTKWTAVAIAFATSLGVYVVPNK